MLLVASALAALGCQGCAGFSQDYAGEPVAVRVGETANHFVASTALPTALGLGNGAPVDRAQVNTSFSTPLYGAPAPASAGEATFIVSDQLFTTSLAAYGNRLDSMDWASGEAIVSYKADRKAAQIAQPLELEHDFSAELSFAAPKERTGFGFDVGIAPRVSYTEEGRFRTRKVGAEVRLGQALGAYGAGPEKGWYVFAGADGEALVWQAGDGAFAGMTDGSMAVRDQITVGDMQAGFAIHRGGGELSLSYIRREVEYRDRNGGHSENEDFAGASFTLKR